MNTKLILLLLVLWFSQFTLVAQVQVNQAILTASGSSTGSNFQVTWSIGEVFTESFESSTLKVTHGLGETIATYVITGLSETREGYSVYPNPFSTDLILEIPGENFDEIMITDLLGKSIRVNVTKQENSFLISPDEMLPGFYILTIKVGTQTHSFKIIKK